MFNESNLWMPHYTHGREALWVEDAQQRSSSLRFLANEFRHEPAGTHTAVPWIGLGQGEFQICFSGGLFQDQLLNVTSDVMGLIISSCSRHEMTKECNVDHDVDCCSSFGAIDRLLSQVMRFEISRPDVSLLVFENETDSTALTQLSLDHVVFEFREDSASTILFSAPYVLLTDVHIESSFSATFAEQLLIQPHCEVMCAEFLHRDYATQIRMTCASDEAKPFSSVSLLDVDAVSHVKHAAPVALLLELKSSFFPGDSLRFSFIVLDQFQSEINDFESDVSLTGSIIAPDVEFQSRIAFEGGNCLSCERGLRISDITLDHVGQSFTLQVRDTDDLLTVNNLSFTVTGCPVGYGTISGAYCFRCSENQFQLESDSKKSCSLCDVTREYHCTGDSVVVEADHWLAIKGVSLVDEAVFSDSSLAFAPCPFGYCCSKPGGCDFVKDEAQLCASNRDPLVPLCGACRQGFSQSITSTVCIRCPKAIYIGWLSYSLAWALLIAAMLVYLRSRRVKIRKTTSEDVFRTPNQQARLRLFLILKISFSRVIWYFEQQLSQILLSSSVVINLGTLSAIFELNLTNSLGVGTELCFLNGLTAKWKIFSNCVLTCFIVVMVIVTSLLVRRFLKSREVFIRKSLLTLLLIGVGQVMSVALQLLRCQRVGDVSVHFYFGDEECYGATWVFGIVLLSAIVVIFSVIFVLVVRMSVDARNDKDAVLQTFIRSYKPQCYLWEFVILSRRVVVIFVSTIFKSSVASVSLIVVLLGYCVAQNAYQPFMFAEVNRIEFICILALILAIAVQALVSLDDQAGQQFAYAWFTLLVILPFILLSMQLVTAVYKHWSAAHKKSDDMRQGEEVASSSPSAMISSNAPKGMPPDFSLEMVEPRQVKSFESQQSAVENRFAFSTTVEVGQDEMVGTQTVQMPEDTDDTKRISASSAYYMDPNTSGIMGMKTMKKNWEVDDAESNANGDAQNSSETRIEPTRDEAETEVH